MKKTFNFILILLFSIIFVLTASLILWGSKGFFANNWLVNKFEIEIQNSLGGAEVSIGDIQFDFFEENSFISATLFKIVLEGSGGKQLAYLNEIEATFDYENLVQLNLKPNSLRLSNSTFVVTKNLEGDFSFEMREGEGASETIKYNELADIITLIEEILEQDQFSKLSLFSASNTNIALVDQKSGKTWWLNQGEFKLENSNKKLSAEFSSNLLYGNDITANARIKLAKRKGEDIEISASIENISVNELSDQFPEYNFLSKFDFPGSLSISAVILNNGKFQGIQGVLEAGKGSILLSSEGDNFLLNSAKFYFDYDIESEIFNIKQATLDTEFGMSVGSGQVLIGDKNSSNGTVLIGQFEFTDTTLFIPKYSKQPVKLESIQTDIEFDLNKRFVKIGQLVASHNDMDVLSSGSVRFTRQGIEGDFNFQMSDISTKKFAEIWPFAKGVKTKAWALKNIRNGYLKNFTGMMSFSPNQNNNFHATFVFDDTDIHLPDNFSPLINASGNGDLGVDYFHINFEEGYLFSEPTIFMDLSGSAIRVLMGKGENPLMNIRLDSVASLPSALTILKDLPKNYRISRNSFPANLKGILFGKTDILFELGKKLSETEIIFSTIGEIKSLSVDNFYGNIDLISDRLTFFANNKEASISGDLDFDGNLISGNWNKSFEKDADSNGYAKGSLKLGRSLLSSLGMDVSQIIASNEALANFSIQFVEGSAPIFDFRSDLKGLGLKLKSMNWTKKPNDTGDLFIGGTLGPIPTITSLLFSSDDLAINGKVYFKDYGELDKLLFKSLKFKDWVNASLEVKKNQKGDFVFDILNGELDLRFFDFHSGNKINLNQIPNLIQLDSVALSDSIRLTDLKAQFLTTDKSSGNFKSRINNGPVIEGSIEIGENGLSININSNDAGAVFKSLGMFDNARSGDLNVILVPEVGKRIYNGELTIRNTRVVNAPALAELLSAVSVIGLLEQMDGQGLAFSESKANFSISSDKIIIHDSSAIGASMGLTMQGELNPLTEEIDAVGVVTPFYAVNGIFEQTGLFAGLLGNKEGEGVFGFNYQINGVGDDLRIEVNPLSILTPGVFRELFNSPMPERSE